MHLRLGLLLGVLAVVETTVVPLIRIGGVGPNLILLEVLAVALFRGPWSGAAFGLLGGALLDVWRGQALGLFALAGGVSGYLFGLLEPRLFKDNLVVPVTAGFVGTLGFELLFLLLSTFTGWGELLWPTFGRVVLLEALYDAALAPLMFGVTANLLRSRGVATVAGKDNA